LQAGQSHDGAVKRALEHICERYWYPLYAHARRLGCDTHAAKDAVQSFFLHLIQTNLAAKAKPEAGLFRSFLLCSLENHLSSARKRDAAQKRGGGQEIFSLDEEAAEARFKTEPADNRSPDVQFDRAWIINLLEKALCLLELEYKKPGQVALFEKLQPVLIKEKEGALPYQEIGAKLGLKEGAVKVAAHRMRRRYRQIVIGLVASTVSDPGEVEKELKHLLRALG